MIKIISMPLRHPLRPRELDLGPEIDQKSTLLAKMGDQRSIIWIKSDFNLS